MKPGLIDYFEGVRRLQLMCGVISDKQFRSLMSISDRITVTIVVKKIIQALTLLSLLGSNLLRPMVGGKKGLLRLGGRMRGYHRADTISI